MKLIQDIADKYSLSTAVVEAILKEYNPTGVLNPPLLVCDDWQRKGGENLMERCVAERRVVWNLFHYLEANGWEPIAYNDGDETEKIISDTPILDAMNAIFAVDECAVAVGKGKKRHDIIFVLGNSGTEVVSDYTYDAKGLDGFKELMEAFDTEKFV